MSRIAEKSGPKLIRPAYCASKPAWSSSGIRTYPLICAKSVSPGLQPRAAVCLRSSRGSSWDGRGGLGPNRLVSPLITFSNCGISSRDECRSILPTPVTRSPLECLDSLESASRGILQNFWIWNRLLPRPIRMCENTGSPPFSSHTVRAITPSKGHNARKLNLATMRSKTRFRYLS